MRERKCQTSERNKLEVLAKVKDSSFKNAEQWTDDAKLLIENSSFGHANALLRFAFEEMAKALVCWYTSEKLWPTESRILKDIFRKHPVKNQLIIGIVYGIIWWEMRRQQNSRTAKKMPEPTDEQIIEAFDLLREMAIGAEKKDKEQSM